MKLDLNTLEIRILLKCYEGMLNKTDVTQIYFKHSMEVRSRAIATLSERGFIHALELPKPGSKKVPVFYEITDKGKRWVKNYLDNYPK
jgi:hypothetical protein